MGYEKQDAIILIISINLVVIDMNNGQQISWKFKIWVFQQGFPGILDPRHPTKIPPWNLWTYLDVSLIQHKNLTEPLKQVGI